MIFKKYLNKSNNFVIGIEISGVPLVVDPDVLDLGDSDRGPHHLEEQVVGGDVHAHRTEIFVIACHLIGQIIPLLRHHCLPQQLLLRIAQVLLLVLQLEVLHGVLVVRLIVFSFCIFQHLLEAATRIRIGVDLVAFYVRTIDCDGLKRVVLTVLVGRLARSTLL